MTPEQIEIEGMRLVAPAHCIVCNALATHEVPFSTEPYYEYYCDACLVAIDRNYLTTPIDPRPLLAQCAALLDSLLGGPVASGGIIDEIRRVRAELAREGW